MKNMNANRFTVDFINRQIIGSKASFAKAGTGSGPIYDELVEKIARHPDFELTVLPPKKPQKVKRAYAGLNKDFMLEYLSIQENSEVLKKEYEEVEKWAKGAKRAVYPTMKKWFFDKFSTEENPFDMKKAHDDIVAAAHERAESAAKKCAESAARESNNAETNSENQMSIVHDNVA